MDDDARELNGDERISKLVEAVDQENVLHTLYWPEQLSDKSKVNEADLFYQLSPLQAAVSLPASPRLILILQILLLAGGSPWHYGPLTNALDRARELGNQEALEWIEGWESGWSDAAVLARDLLETELEDAEGTIRSAGLGIDAEAGAAMETDEQPEELADTIQAYEEDLLVEPAPAARELESTNEHRNSSTPFSFPIAAPHLSESDASRTQLSHLNTATPFPTFPPPAPTIVAPLSPPSSQPFPLPVLYIDCIPQQTLTLKIKASLDIRARGSPILRLEHKLRQAGGRTLAYALVWLDSHGLAHEAVEAVDNGVLYPSPPSTLPSTSIPIPSPNKRSALASTSVHLIVSSFPRSFKLPQLRSILDLHLRPNALHRVSIHKRIGYIDVASEEDARIVTAALEGRVFATGAEGLKVQTLGEAFNEAGTSRAMSPTSARGIMLEPRPPPMAGQEELDDWAICALNGRFPADYRQSPPEAVEGRSQAPGMRSTMAWRSSMCWFWPPRVGRSLCRGKTCNFAHDVYELRRVDGTLVHPLPKPLPPIATVVAPPHSFFTSAGTPAAAHSTPTLPVSEVTGGRSTSAVVSSTISSAHESSLPLLQAPSPSPPRADSIPPPCSLESSRINSLHLPPQSLTAYSLLCEAIYDPPSPNFTRTVELSASFGWAHPAVAEEELRGPPAYPENAGLQHLYETFLRSQTGESRDHFNVFFAQLSEISDRAKTFMEAGRLAAARPLAREMEEVEWDPYGDGVQFGRAGKGMAVKTLRERRAFGFAERVRRAFVRG